MTPEFIEDPQRKSIELLATESPFRRFRLKLSAATEQDRELLRAIVDDGIVQLSEIGFHIVREEPYEKNVDSLTLYFRTSPTPK